MSCLVRETRRTAHDFDRVFQGIDATTIRTKVHAAAETDGQLVVPEEETGTCGKRLSVSLKPLNERQVEVLEFPCIELAEKIVSEIPPANLIFVIKRVSSASFLKCAKFASMMCAQ